MSFAAHLSCAAVHTTLLNVHRHAAWRDVVNMVTGAFVGEKGREEGRIR